MLVCEDVHSVASATQLMPIPGSDPFELPLHLNRPTSLSPGGTVRLDLTGELCTDTVPLVRHAALEILEEPVERLVLDFGGVTFVDGRGLSLLIELARSCQEREAVLRVRRPSGQAKLILSIAGLEHLIDR